MLWAAFFYSLKIHEIDFAVLYFIQWHFSQQSCMNKCTEVHKYSKIKTSPYTNTQFRAWDFSDLPLQTRFHIPTVFPLIGRVQKTRREEKHLVIKKRCRCFSYFQFPSPSTWIRGGLYPTGPIEMPWLSVSECTNFAFVGRAYAVGRVDVWSIWPAPIGAMPVRVAVPKVIISDRGVDRFKGKGRS